MNIEIHMDTKEKSVLNNSKIFILDETIQLCIHNLSDLESKNLKILQKKFISMKSKSFDLNQKDNIRMNSLVLDIPYLLQNQMIEGNCLLKLNDYNQHCLQSLDQTFPNGCIIDITNLPYKKILELLKNNDFSNQIKLKDKYNPCSLLTKEELLKQYQMIKQIKDQICYYNFTKLEKLIFLYDQVRERIYRHLETNKSISRDLNQVLLHEYIVCEGYSNIILAVCEALEIPCEKICWLPLGGNKGHASVLIYLDDPDYHIHQFVELDAVYGRKRGPSDQTYLNYYKNLFNSMDQAKTNKAMFEYDNRLMIDEPMEQYRHLQHIEEMCVPNLVKKEFYLVFLKKVLRVCKNIGLQSLQSMCEEEWVQIEKDNFRIESIQKIYQQYLQLFNQSIKQESLIQAIYKVRRIEHYRHPKKYPLTPDLFDQIISQSFSISKEEKLLNLVLSKTPIDIVGQMEMLNQKKIKNPLGKMKLDIKRIELLNTFNQELKNKQKRR